MARRSPRQPPRDGAVPTAGPLGAIRGYYRFVNANQSRFMAAFAKLIVITYLPGVSAISPRLLATASPDA
jgi:hypothetical protein